MERKMSSADPFERNVPPGKGIIYIFSGAVVGFRWGKSRDPLEGYVCHRPWQLRLLPIRGQFWQIPVQNRKPLHIRHNDEGSWLTGELTVHVKPGYVYYLRVKVVPFAYYDLFLENMPHQEAADMIKSYNLNVRK